VFAITQIPVAAVEAIFTVIVLGVIARAPGLRIAALEGWAGR